MVFLTKLLGKLRGEAGNGGEDPGDLRKSVEELSKGLSEVKKATMDLAERVDKLTKFLGDLSREVGKLSDSFGFIVEDVARSLLPAWLYLNMGIAVNELSRAFFNVEGRVVEVDFYGEGADNHGERVLVLGEAKARIHGDDVKAFHEKAQEILKQSGSAVKYVLVMYGLYVHPSALREALHRNIMVISPYNIVTQAQSKVSQVLHSNA